MNTEKVVCTSYISNNNKSMLKILDKIRLYNYQGIYHRQGNRIAVPRVGYSRLNIGNGNAVSVKLLHILSFNPNCIGGGGADLPRFFLLSKIKIHLTAVITLEHLPKLQFFIYYLFL